MRAWYVLLLVGCNEFYGLDDTRLPSPTACSGVRFGVPRPIEQFVSGDAEYDGQLNASGTELWYSMSGAPDKVYRGTRASLDEPFAIETPDFGVSSSDVTDPSMTADGHRLFVKVVGSGGEYVLEAIRSDPTTSTFESIRIVAGLGSVPVSAIDISWDGLRMYFTRGNELHVASRPTFDAPFADEVELFGGVDYPSVSPDELEIFYTQPFGRILFRRTRADLDSAWGPEEFVLDDAADPDVAPGSDKLIITRNDALAILERACP